jgi:hypothetical protein
LVPFEQDLTPPDAAASEDSGSVAPDAAAELDALPPVDVTVPHDAFNDCPDGGATFIYVVTENGRELMSFYPPTGEFRSIGTLQCPGETGSPFSMAVDRTGIAYVLFSDGELFRVSTATAACRRTGFVSGQRGYSPTFGMGYSHDSVGTGETLYVASDGPSGLATIDTTHFTLDVIGLFSPPVGGAELTGTGAGDLFGFYATKGSTICDGPHASCTDSAIGQIDKSSGKITNQSVLKGLNQGDAWAFAFWGGDFYTFTDPAMMGTTVVTRFSPADGSLASVATLSGPVVGAGVSTCAPAQ